MRKPPWVDSAFRRIKSRDLALRERRANGIRYRF